MAANNDSDFYMRAANYWSKVPATVDGVLSGFGHISDIDIEGSKAFLKEILCSVNPPGTELVLDCGAGIGRVTKYLLIPQFENVDLVEQDQKFIDTVEKFIGEGKTKIGTLHKISLQNFKPQKKYDMIWCQWITCHLKDYDLISFLERCRDALKENGVIIVKENIAQSSEIEYDDEDSSVTRPYALMETLFKEAKLKIVKAKIQTDFPDDIYPVHMFALVPIN